VLFLGIPSRQERGEIIREPISSKWNEVTRALQTLSQTLYTLKNTLDIENAQKILTQIPTMPTDERATLLEFSKAAYGFVSWYRSAFDFSVAQQDMWEKVEKALVKEPAYVTLRIEEPVQHVSVVATERKSTRTYKKKETSETKPSKTEKDAPVAAPVLASFRPAPKILSLRKMV